MGFSRTIKAIEVMLEGEDEISEVRLRERHRKVKNCNRTTRTDNVVAIGRVEWKCRSAAPNLESGCRAWHPAKAER